MVAPMIPDAWRIPAVGGGAVGERGAQTRSMVNARGAAVGRMAIRPYNRPWTHHATRQGGSTSPAPTNRAAPNRGRMAIRPYNRPWPLHGRGDEPPGARRITARRPAFAPVAPAIFQAGCRGVSPYARGWGQRRLMDGEHRLTPPQPPGVWRYAPTPARDPTIRQGGSPLPRTGEPVGLSERSGERPIRMGRG